jgi:hypothetical protein
MDGDFADDLILLEDGGRRVIHQRGNVVIRDAGPWTPTVHPLLRHLEEVGFNAAPRLIGTGLGSGGREVLTFIEGEFTQPGPWSLNGAVALGTLLRSLHEATGSFRPPQGAVWFPWHGRDLGGRPRSLATRTLRNVRCSRGYGRRNARGLRLILVQPW